jgi:hypothetical protein
MLNKNKIIISISDFPYGKPSRNLIKAVDWLNKHTCTDEFDFPDYGGMPKNISDRLFSDEVDWIQSFIIEGTNGIYD